MQTVPNSRRNSRSIQTVDIKLQSKLIDTWTDHYIPQFYEHIFLNYIKRIPVSQAQAQIKEEIRQVEKYESYVQLFVKALREKTKIEEFVALTIKTEKNKHVEIDYPHFCQCISQLRDTNYRAAYYLCKIRQKYEETDDVSKSPEKLFFNNFAIKVDKFRKILAKSQISKYIAFQEDYDPFFINIKQLGNPVYHKDSQAVQQLFMIPLDSSYNFLKMKKILISWLPYSERRKDLDQKDYLPYLEFNRYADLTPNNRQENKERSLDIQRLKQEIKEEFQYAKRNHSPTYLETQENRVDGNKTRYFKSSPRKDDRLVKINKMFNSYSYQPELVSKSYGEDHFNSLMNSHFQMPSRKLRKSQDIGRIKRSRVSQLTNDIASNHFRNRDSRIASQSTQYIADNTICYRPQRLQTINYLPKKTSITTNNQYSEDIYQRSKRQYHKSQTNSRQLQNSPTINIMISPMKERNSGRSIDKEKSSVSSYEANTPQRKQSIVQLYNKELQNQSKPNQTGGNKAKINRETVQESLLINKQQINLSKQRQNLNTRQRTSPAIVKQNQNQQYLVASKRSKQPQLVKSQNPSELYSTVKQQSNKKSEEGQTKNISMSNSTANNLTYRGNQYNPTMSNQDATSSPQTNGQNASLKSQKNIPQPKITLNSQNSEVKRQNTSTNIGPSKIQPQSKAEESEYKINVIPSKPMENIDNNQSQALKSTEQKVSPQTKQNSQPNSSQQSSLSVNKAQQKRQIKIKVGKMSYDSLVQYIKSYEIHPQYQNKYDFNKILKETEYQQTYLTQFTINNEPRALALSSLVPPNSNFAIRLWIIHKAIDQNLSVILFKKYIQLVQKYITSPVIFFKGEEMQETKSLSFQFKKEKLYSKGRTTKPRQIQRQFENFLNCQCSHINFVQKQKEDILFSQQIQTFNENNSLAADYLFKIENTSAPQKLNFLLNIHKNVPNFVKVNKILSDQDLDGYEVNKSINIQSIDLLSFAYHTEVKDPFVACDGFFKFYGIEVISSAQTNLYFINLTKNGGKMYFGRGFPNILAFSKSLNSDSAKRGCFSVPMFTKNLYGRYTKVSEKEKGFYGNWQFSLVWQDEMQGRLKHTTEKGFSFTNQPFYVGLQIEGNLLYCFQVSKEDFLF